MAGLLLVGCGQDDGEPVLTTTTSTTAQETTTTEAEGVTIGQVREAILGTAACPDDPSCPVVDGVEVDGDTLLVSTVLVDDADATIPGRAVCAAVAATVWDGPVRVLASDGSILFSGQRDRQPICSEP